MSKFSFKLVAGSLAISLLMSWAAMIIGSSPAAAAASSTNTVKQQGIQGIITVGPTSLICGGVSDPCYVPYQTTMTVYNNGGKLVTTFTSDANGHFKVNLSTGTYTITPVDPLALPSASAQTVRVLSGQYTTVSIQFDSGIR